MFKARLTLAFGTAAAPARDTGRDDEESAGNEVTADGDSSEAEADGDDQLSRLQSDVAMRRQRLLEGKSQLSHSVHCPYYPCDKQEYWSVFISLFLNSSQPNSESTTPV